MLVNRRGCIIEASLNNGIFNATHFLRWGGRKIFDCGIDSRDISWSLEDFRTFYENAHWRIDQVVRISEK